MLSGNLSLIKAFASRTHSYRKDKSVILTNEIVSICALRNFGQGARLEDITLITVKRGKTGKPRLKQRTV